MTRRTQRVTNMGGQNVFSNLIQTLHLKSILRKTKHTFLVTFILHNTFLENICFMAIHSIILEGASCGQSEENKGQARTEHHLG